MHKDVGIIVENNKSHLDTAAKLYNSYSSKQDLNQFVLFCSDSLGFASIPQLPIHEAHFFDGNIVLFNNNSLLLAKGFVNYQKIYYVLEQPDWTYVATISSHKAIKKLYTETENLFFITNNENIYQLYKMLWGDNIILGDLNYEKIIQ